MGLKNASLTAEATIAVTGGSALAFASDGMSIQNGVHLIVPADLDYQTRRQMTVKNRPPTLDPKTGAWGKDKKSISIAFPAILADGRTVFHTLRLEREVHPSIDPGYAVELNKLGAQALIDADMADFWAVGSLE